jgi:hypothetical protein
MVIVAASIDAAKGGGQIESTFEMASTSPVSSASDR